MALVIMTIFLAVGMSLSAVLISQKETIRGMDFSVRALAAADTGIEAIAYADKKCTEPGCDPAICKTTGEPVACLGLQKNVNFGPYQLPKSEAQFSVVFTRNCGVSTIEATGVFKGVKRALKVSYGDSLVGTTTNFATTKSCRQICEDLECRADSIGTNGDGDNNMFYSIFPAEPVTCVENPGSVDTIMMSTGETCPPLAGGNPTDWTYCNCGEE